MLFGAGPVAKSARVPNVPLPLPSQTLAALLPALAATRSRRPSRVQVGRRHAMRVEQRGQAHRRCELVPWRAAARQLQRPPSRRDRMRDRRQPSVTISASSRMPCSDTDTGTPGDEPVSTPLL